MIKLEGIIPPIVTPFVASGELDLESLRNEVKYLIEAGVNGLVVGGSGGEGYSFKSEELADAVMTVKETSTKLAGRQFPILAGVLANSTQEAKEYATAAMEAGADALQMTPIPTYLYKPSIEETVQAFSDVGEAVGLPIVIYNVVPTNKLSAADLSKIASVKQVVAIKQSGVDINLFADVVLAVGDRFTIISALDDMLLPSFLLGAKASICGASSMLPGLAVELFRLCKEGKYRECLPIHWKILRVVRATMFRGPYESYGDMISRIKFAIAAQGRSAGFMRAPFSEPNNDVQLQITEALQLADTPVVAKVHR